MNKRDGIVIAGVLALVLAGTEALPEPGLAQAFRKASSLAAKVRVAGAGAGAAAAVKPADWSKWFTDGLVDAAGKSVPVSSLNGKLVAIYFSSHHCPPCRAFTPKLVTYRDQNAKIFEVVFVSVNDDKATMQSYMTGAGMKWPAVPHGSKSGKDLASKFNVWGIPRLVLLAPDGSTLMSDARSYIESKVK